MTDEITMTMTTDNARLLARALRCLDGNATDETLNALSELGHDLGALLGMTSNTDKTDEIDELPSGELSLWLGDDLLLAGFGE
jgi:hypothetical protein